MRKLTIIALLSFLGLGQLTAQVNLYSTDFETYTVGQKIAQQAGSPWTTWSSAPGGAEDAVVSSTQSHSPTKSVYVVTNNDLVLNLFDKTSGRFRLSWWMYVETGKLGYFNLLNNFNAANSTWALQGYFYNDSVYVDAGGESAGKAQFPDGTWKKITVIVDLDDDFATLYFDSEEIVSYKFSGGTFGTGSTLKLDAINFFGWDGSSAPTPTSSTIAGFYIDDLAIDSMPVPESPANLDANFNAPDIDVVWTAPSTPPDLYKLSRNSKIVHSTTSTSYTDVAPWANTYRYVVRAHYDQLGYSHGSNMDSATVPGGVERDKVLFEVGTGTWCQYCPGAAMGIRDLIEVNGKDAVAIKYHSGDNYEIPAGAARLGYYGIDAFPTTVADGGIYAVGGSATVSSYPTFLNMYNERIATPGFHVLNVSVVPTTGQNYQATITIQQSFQAFPDGLVLHTALTESNIPEAWGNQTEVDCVLRGMFPDEYGTDLDFSVQNPITLTIPFSTAGFVKNNCEFVVFVQHAAMKEVTQATVVNMSSVVGMEELNGQQVTVYPNPASDFVSILSNGQGMMGVYDIAGKLILSREITQALEGVDVSCFAPGIYILRVENGNSSFTQKLVVE